MTVYAIFVTMVMKTLYKKETAMHEGASFPHPVLDDTLRSVAGVLVGVAPVLPGVAPVLDDTLRPAAERCVTTGAVYW